MATIEILGSGFDPNIRRSRDPNQIIDELGLTGVAAEAARLGAMRRKEDFSKLNAGHLGGGVLALSDVSPPLSEQLPQSTFELGAVDLAGAPKTPALPEGFKHLY